MNVRVADEPLVFTDNNGQPIFTIQPDGKFLIGDQEMPIPAVQQAMFAQFAQAFVESNANQGKTILKITSHAARIVTDLQAAIGDGEPTAEQKLFALQAQVFPEVEFAFDPATDGNVDIYIGLLERLKHNFYNAIQMAELRAMAKAKADEQKVRDLAANQVVENGADVLQNGEPMSAPTEIARGSTNGKTRVTNEDGSEYVPEAYQPVNPPVDAPPITQEDMTFLSGQPMESLPELEGEDAASLQRGIDQAANGEGRVLDLNELPYEGDDPDLVNAAIAAGGIVVAGKIITQDGSYETFKRAWEGTNEDAVRMLLSSAYPDHHVTWSCEQVTEPADPLDAASAATEAASATSDAASTIPSGEPHVLVDEAGNRTLSSAGEAFLRSSGVDDAGIADIRAKLAARTQFELMAEVKKLQEAATSTASPTVDTSSTSKSEPVSDAAPTSPTEATSTSAAVEEVGTTNDSPTSASPVDEATNDGPAQTASQESSAGTDEAASS